MTVHVTKALGSQFASVGGDLTDFVDKFERWKSKGPSGEHESYFFGKDGAYTLPAVNGVRYILRHAHLVPRQDPASLARWEQRWKNRSRKTSNRVLVYVSDVTHGHLLIYILEEPDAHEVAEMLTPAQKTLMLQFAQIADAFIQNGRVLG